MFQDLGIPPLSEADRTPSSPTPNPREWDSDADYRLECAPRAKRVTASGTEYEIKYADTTEPTESLRALRRKAAAHGLEITGTPSRLPDGRYTVSWDWSWITADKLGADWIEAFENDTNTLETLTRQKQQATVTAIAVPTVDFEVDLRESDPEGDTGPLTRHGISHDPDTDLCKVYNASGDCRGNLTLATLRTLYEDAVQTHGANLSHDTFTSEIVALVERYSVRRGAATKAQKHQFQQEWATPLIIRQKLAKILQVRHELFSHPLNHARCFKHSWSRDPRDAFFGQHKDAYSWNWWDACYMNPEFGERDLHKAVTHAIIAARTAPRKKRVYTVAFLPMMDRAYDDLLLDPTVRLIWEFDRGNGFQYTTPEAWTGSDGPTKVSKKGADFGIGLYIIGNNAGLAAAEALATTRNEWATKPWDKLHTAMAEYMESAQLEPLASTNHYPSVGVPNPKRRHLHRQIARFPTNVSSPDSPKRPLQYIFRRLWNTFKHDNLAAPFPRRWPAERCIYTDGGVGKTRAGAGIFWETSQESENATWDGWQNAPVAELVAIRTAVERLVEKSWTGEWHIFTDCKTVLQGMHNFKINPRRAHGRPYTKTFAYIDSLAVKNDIHLVLHKVKAHIGIPGNESADEAARHAHTDPPADATDWLTPQHVAEMHDAANGVRKYTYSSRVAEDGVTETARSEVTQTKHAKHWAERHTPFRAATVSRWRDRLKKDGPLLPLHTKSLVGIRPAERKCWYQTVHKETLYQWKAIKFLKKAHSLDPRISQLNTNCPICGNGTDTEAHQQLWCSAEPIKDLRGARHNDGLRKILDAAGRGDKGKWLLTGDIPKYTLQDHETQNELAARLPKQPAKVTRKRVRQRQRIMEKIAARQVPIAESEDGSDTETHTPYFNQMAPDEGGIDMGALATTSLTRVTSNMSAHQQGTTPPPTDIDTAEQAEADPKAPVAGPHGQYLPAFKYPYKDRPDGVLYENLTRNDWNIDTLPDDLIVHIIEYYVSSANYWSQKADDKLGQYTRFRKWCKDNTSIPDRNIRVHLFPMTYEGFMPADNLEEMRSLGIRPAAQKLLKLELERDTRVYAKRIKWARRAEECKTEYYAGSGYYWYKKYSKAKRRRERDKG
jgi:ribonuclease HI